MSGFHLRYARRVLQRGGIVAYPTEAVYGLGCDPLNPQAVMRLLAIKQRPWQKGMILIASSQQQLEPYLRPIGPAVQKKLTQSWPGPVTWLLPARPEVPWWLRGEHVTLAVRVTAHPLAAALCEQFGGPVVSTSANLAGHEPARSALTVRRELGDKVDYILHGTLGNRGRPTEIRDAQTGRIIRAG
ncbi:MAG: L-threonylcarbamoyladenylate synthase [Gammaproteobacteria bacterium]|nr:L-threonylcarbamoyladenylate synthase [Gammaproteobacteria bacterium]MCW8840478.1 L-threonylcarbamoyladenylate synthase [Gammaproteobacteria bacterium]MCW8927455.1 L-threonylcarbamoyladenylate synthase [Gammaproteobacteria bacterium]MCW8958437.1 L-threonylcarbamoyladenylate synthase [Gammaproteobacteria bacterium]MCW8972130.1 L-threonylcarbamoyladenylate synthase [Gammaproteobacteria bacterium]